MPSREPAIRRTPATLDTLRGVSPRVASALAVLAIRGDSAALSTLVNSLDDARPYVREWTLRAMRELPADLRDPPLRAIAGSLRDAKTKIAVDALLDTEHQRATH